MLPKKYEVQLDIYKGVLNPQDIRFTTEDNGQCMLTFKILEDKITPYDLTGCMVRMVIDGQQQNCTITSQVDGTVSITLLQSMFSTPGFYGAELQIYDVANQTVRLTTPQFRYYVAKSLMNDSTVAADSNFSILQDMILDVSNADQVSTQAKTTAEAALVTANQAVANANTVTANGDYAKAQGDYAKSEGAKVAGRITLDQATKTNFDFIENKVVQDGLLSSAKINSVNRVDTGIDTRDINIFIYITTQLKYDGSKIYILGQGSNSAGFILSMYRANILRLTVYTEQGVINKDYTYSFNSDASYDIKFTKIGTTFNVFINNNLCIELNNTTLINHSGTMAINGYSGNYGSYLGITKYYSVYNRSLTPQEIQHNLSVFNNSSSTNQLHVTNSTNQTSILSFGSTGDHVEMATGRTLEQEYMCVLKTMGKEYVSTDGSDITVDNGIEARVIGAEITGNTKRLDADGNECEAGTEGARLVSTEATIMNNGVPYKFYASEEDKANKKQILLGGVGGVSDKLTLNSDGSLSVIREFAEAVFEGKDDESYFKSNTLNNTVAFDIGITNGFKSGKISCDSIHCLDGSDDVKHTRLSGNSPSRIVVWIPKNELISEDTAGLKDYFSKNPAKYIYQLATPTTTTIPKEVNAPVLTDKSNICSFGEGVKPTSCILTLPCADGLKKEYTPTLLNGYTAVADSFSPRIALRQDNRVEISLNITSPATFNATVLSLPTDCRPSKDIKVLGFVDNIATPIIIKATGEIQLPNSVISKNVYIKEYFRLGVL